MLDYDKAPHVSDQLLEFLKEALSVDILLSEGDSQGQERLGFIKGARFAYGILENIQRAAKLREEADTLQV